MAIVRDPAFWKRFSVAVHNDDADRAARSQRPTLKHSYVHSISCSAPSTVPTSPVRSALASPTNSTHPLWPSSPTPTQHPPPPRLTRQPSVLKKPMPTAQPYSHRNSSALTLGLSGRPASRFKFWTSISADPSNRDSWLESQLKKKKQRTWMCWAFWLVFAILVAGVVVTILLLKSKGII